MVRRTTLQHHWRRMLVAVLLIGYGACRTPSSPPDMRTLEAALIDTLDAHPEATVAVAVRDPSTGAALSIRGDRRFHAASTMKVPVMIEVFRQAEAGRFALTDSLLLHNRFASIVDGSAYRIEDDSDAAIYERLGTQMTIRALTERMITQSSNLATNLIVERVTPEAVQQTLERLGAWRMDVHRGVEDLKAFRQGLNNTATADDLATLLQALADEAAVSPPASRAMVEILKRQTFDDMIPAGLSEGAAVAHKTGWITGVRHDAAIVYPHGRPLYVLVVLTEGIADSGAAARLIARMARTVHDHLRPAAP